MKEHPTGTGAAATGKPKADGSELGRAVSRHVSASAEMALDSAISVKNPFPQLDWEQCTPVGGGAIFEAEHGLRTVQGTDAAPQRGDAGCGSKKGR